MRRRTGHARLRALAVAAAVLLAREAAAQELAKLFPSEADVRVPAAGLVRLPLPPEVLAGAGPDLADLRLFDSAGHEVPYLVDPGLPPNAERQVTRKVEARVADLSRDTEAREHLPARTRETYRIALPEPPPSGEEWSLVVESKVPRYVRSAEVVGIDDTGARVVLVPRASLVRLGQRSVDRNEIALPRFGGPEIAVAIDGEEGSFLEPTFSFTSRRPLPQQGELTVPLAIRRLSREGNRSVLDVERPAGLVPARLRIATSTPVLDRRVKVWSVAPSGTRSPLGEGRIVRATGIAGGPIEDLEVGVGWTREPGIRIEIEDGDSPPLADLALSVAASQPAILFALPAASPGDPAGVLRFGGDRAWRPHYDVANLFRDALAVSPHGDALADPTAVPSASLGPVRPNPLYDARPALAAVIRAGTAIDPGDWRWRRRVVVPESPEGVVRLALDPEDAAHAMSGFADLRIVDAQNRQWPYLLARARHGARVDLALRGPERDEDGVSRWGISLPAAPLALERLIVHPARPVLGRSYRVIAEPEAGDEHVVARGTLVQDLRRPAPIEISLDGRRFRQLALLVEDGDDAPIEIGRVEASIATPEIVITAPAGEYALMAGNPDAEAPAYEISSIRDMVLGLQSVRASTGAGEESTGFADVFSGLGRSTRLRQIAVWSAIVAAVGLLVLVTLRVSGSGAKRPD